MPYILNKTSGVIVTVVPDASLDQTTDLTFVGRNYAGYGEVQNENFLKLLENFSNTTPPTKPIEGQIWYDQSANRINVYNGNSWKPLANVESTDTNPIGTKEFYSGDLWWNSTAEQLYVYNGDSFVLIGPPTGADTRAQWRGSYEYSVDEGTSAPKYNIKAVLGGGDEIIAVVSDQTYVIQADPGSQSFPMAPLTQKIYKGITLAGADPTTGVSAVSSSSGIILWGTAAHALNADTSNISAATAGILIENNTATAVVHYVTFASDEGTGALNIDKDGLSYVPSTNTLQATIFAGTATSAYYADLAEKYLPDAIYEPGTVVSVGGEKEIRESRFGDRALGVVSTNPAFMMNKDLEGGIYVALKGRAPCKVIGAIKKGDRLVATDNGHAVKATFHQYSDVFSISLEDNSDVSSKIIEVAVI